MSKQTLGLMSISAIAEITNAQGEVIHFFPVKFEYGTDAGDEKSDASAIQDARDDAAESAVEWVLSRLTVRDVEWKFIPD